jgi:hypothetical protein
MSALLGSQGGIFYVFTSYVVSDVHNAWHFHWAKSGEYVTQVSAIGPLGLDDRNQHDDPRRQSRTDLD